MTGRGRRQGRGRRWLRRAAIALALLVVAGLATFAVPLRGWRTGEQPAPELALLPAAALPVPPRRIWIDTDAACGEGPRTDSDDCLAILALARDPRLEIVGLSTVFGNAPLAVTDRVTRELARQLAAEGSPVPGVHRGAAAPLPAQGAPPPTAASAALAAALAAGELAIVALGPLTNVAAALAGRPAGNGDEPRVVAVMGRRIGHLFHPAEGAGGGILFGHGPVFRDFNLAQDVAAAARVVAAGVPLALVPYEAARSVEVTAADLDRLAATGGAGRWVAARARGWLRYWQTDIGRPGFYPFDLLAAGFALEPGRFGCARVEAWVGEDPTFFIPFWRPAALLVAQGDERRSGLRAAGRALYCAAAEPEVAIALRRALGAGPAAGRGRRGG